MVITGSTICKLYAVIENACYASYMTNYVSLCSLHIPVHVFALAECFRIRTYVIRDN